MKSTKRFFWTTGAGALIGAIVFAWISPYLIVWYFSPPAELSLSCSPAVEWGINTYRKVVFTGVLLGVMFGVLFFVAFLRGKKPNTSGAGGGSAPA